jgi:hypothetical protein
MNRATPASTEELANDAVAEVTGGSATRTVIVVMFIGIL